MRRVRNEYPYPRHSILMLTADDFVRQRTAVLESGADDYVSKSVAPEILLLRVRALLRGSGERAPKPVLTGGLFPSRMYSRDR